MTQEELDRLIKAIFEQMKAAALDPGQVHLCSIRLQETFLDTNRECIRRIEIAAEEEVAMQRAVLKYCQGAKQPDARVAIARALDSKFETEADVQSWIEVWDP